MSLGIHGDAATGTEDITLRQLLGPAKVHFKDRIALGLRRAGQRRQRQQAQAP